jgi:DNA/RNA endonuclease YhcR with UshA esterase domain
MKNLIILFALVFFANFAFAQTVPLDSVKYYEGKSITVCSKVLDTYEAKTGEKTTFLNFGKPYPNSTFTVVIFEADLPKFKYTPSVYLKGKDVCITGTIKIYKGKPEIIVSAPEQIKTD